MRRRPPLPHTRRSTTLAAAASVLACGAIAFPAAAGAAVPQIEQVNRGTGANGAFALIQGPVEATPGVISNTGRYAAYSLNPVRFDPAFDLGLSTLGTGLFVRDVAANTTTKLSGGPAFLSGLDSGEKVFSFITREGLDAADTNGKPDLYLYDRTTGRKLLVSRTDGYSGPALGVTSEGSVLRGGRYAVFGTADGVLRRDLWTGKNAKVSGGSYAGVLIDDIFSLTSPALSDEHASADGSVIATSEGIFAHGRTTAAPKDEAGTPVVPFVSKDGSRAVWQLAQGAEQTRILSTATGVVTTPATPAAFAGRTGPFVLRLSDDGKRALTTSFDLATFASHFDEWDLDTGTLTPIAFPFGVLPSRNLRYAQTVAGGPNPVVLALGSPGANLPGSIEVPSPNAYLQLTDECSYGSTGFGRYISVRGPVVSDFLPAARQVRVQVTRPDGKIVVDQLLKTLEDGGDTLVPLPAGIGAYRLTATLTLADGRTSYERTNRPAGPACVED